MGASSRYAFTSWPLGRFLDRLASAEAVPGGGAAAAIAVSLALSLSEMVAGINAGRGSRPSRKAAARWAALRRRSAAAAGLDAEAFARLSAIPRGERGSRKHRDASRAAAEVPLGLCVLTVLGSAGLASERTRTSRWLMSDLLEAAVLYRAAFDCARVNVEVNLSSTDAAVARRIRGRLTSLRRQLEANLRKFRETS